MAEREPGAGAPVTVLTVAYDGAAFHGFARQPGLDTVQGTLERALATALRRPVETTGAGRTDTGVHALAQVVSLESQPGDPDSDRLMRSIDALSGPGIVITDVRQACAGFSARFDALAREYRYRIVEGSVPPLFLSGFAWHVPYELDLSAIEAAARCLVGEHDFRSFCQAQSAVGKTTMRRVDEVSLARERHLGEECLTITVKGNAFLHSMVRIMVGSLVEVGRRQREPDWMCEALSALDRSAAGETAPPHGLTLWGVEYPKEVWL